MRTWEFYRHMPVYLPRGRRLGHAVEIGHAVDYLHVQQGHILIQDWYIPMSAVDAVDDDGVRLNVDLAGMKREGWNAPPQELLQHQGATPGYEYTSRADVPAYGAAKGGGAEPLEDVPSPDAAFVTK
ncbi:MAG: hypothetical protein ACRDFS_05345 [Chloroflexota bacterium]